MDLRHRKLIIYIILIGLLVTIGYVGLTRYVWAPRETINYNQPVLAIVIDDFGGADIHGVEELLSLDRPITAAVMPNLVHSIDHSLLAHQNGHEVIMHQPMQPVKGKLSWLGPGAIMSDMDPEQIRETFIKNLETVPHAKGFNNHTGSKVTSQEEKIKPLLEVCKEKGLFVLDSRTSMDSVVIPVAKSMSIPWAKRDIFLDDIKSDRHINRQIQKACKVAQKQGYAIAIGHVGQGGKVTARSIKAAIPIIEKQGIRLVPVSEIIKISNRSSDI